MTLAVIAAGCGGTGTQTSTPPEPARSAAVRAPSAHHTSKAASHPRPTAAHLIDSFQAGLVNYHVVRVHWTLVRPAALELVIAGVRHGSSSNQTSGILAIRPSDADTHRTASRTGTDRLDFEFGEYNFHGYRRVRFRLRAWGPDRTIDTSRSIVLSRPARSR